MTDTATPETVTGELVPVGRQTIFDISDVESQLVEARRQAAAITQVIDAEKLSMRIGRSEHVLFEGWATLGAFNGVSVHTIWTRPLPDGAGWEARAETRTLDGRVVGTAEAMCSRSEKNWARAEDYAIRSMAQTRAGSKAFKGPLSWVMVLAGKSAVPAEEVDGETSADAADAKPPAWAEHVSDVPAVADDLVDVLKGVAGEQAAALVGQLGQGIFDECDGGIPVCVAHLAHHLREVVLASGPAGAPEGPQEGPEASTPGAMPSDPDNPQEGPES